MKRVSLSAHCVGCLVMLGSLTLFSLLVPSAAGQQPDGWRQLPLAEFVKTIRTLTDGNEGVAETLWQEIRTQSTDRLLQVVAQKTVADYGDLVNLYLWRARISRPNRRLPRWPRCNPPPRRPVPGRLKNCRTSSPAWAGRHRSRRTLRLDGELARRTDVRTLENVDQLGWLFSQVQHVDRKEIGEQRFSVQWTGLVLAPANGEYTFSISPLDLNYNHGGTFRDQKVVVYLGDKQILESSSNGYTYQAEPVMLTAGTPVPLRVDLTYACTSQGVIDDRPAIAQLFWEGPGLKKQLVPNTALRTPDGSQNGLQGVYQLAGGGQEVNVTRIDPRIAFTWIHQNFVLSSHDACASNWRPNCRPLPAAARRSDAGNKMPPAIPSGGKLTGPCWNHSMWINSRAGFRRCSRIRRCWMTVRRTRSPISIVDAESARRTNRCRPWDAGHKPMPMKRPSCEPTSMTSIEASIANCPEKSRGSTDLTWNCWNAII